MVLFFSLVASALYRAGAFLERSRGEGGEQGEQPAHTAVEQTLKHLSLSLFLLLSTPFYCLPKHNAAPPPPLLFHLSVCDRERERAVVTNFTVEMNSSKLESDKLHLSPARYYYGKKYSKYVYKEHLKLDKHVRNGMELARVLLIVLHTINLQSAE